MKEQFLRCNCIPAFLTVVFLVVVAFLSSPAYAVDVTLQWDANVQPELAGYKVFYKADSSGGRTPGNYTGTGASEGPSPFVMSLTQDENPDQGVVEFTVHNLDSNKIYFFVVTAFDTEGLESVYSNEAATIRIVNPQKDFHVDVTNYKNFTVQGVTLGSSSVEIFAEDISSGLRTSMGTAVADSSGNWTKSVDLSAGKTGKVNLIVQTQTAFSSPIEGFARGDVSRDGSIDSGDAILVLRYSVGLRVLTVDDKWAGNVTDKPNNEDIDSGDAIKILRYSVGLINDF
jgi:hypothetical protein